MKISKTSTPIQKPVLPFHVAAFIFLMTGTLALWGIFNVFMPDTQTLVYFGVCGFIASLVSVLILSSRLRRGHSCLGLLVLNIGCLFWFWLEILILSVSEVPFRNLYAGSPIASTFPNYLVAEGFILLIAFTGLSVVGWLLVSLSLARVSYQFFGVHNRRIERSHREGRVDILLFALSLCGWVPIISSSGGLQLAIQNMIGLRTTEIELTVGFSSYLPIVAIVGSGIALARLVEGSTKYNLLAIASIVFGGFIALSSGTRFKLIFLVAPALVCLFDMLKYRDARKKTYLYFTLFAFLTLVLSAGQFAFRYASSFGISDFDVLSVFAGSEHFSAALNAIHMMKFQDAFQQSMAMLFVTDLIPRFIWENKPIHEYWLFYNQISLGGNVTPSILGQYYMNWGAIGVLVSGLIFGVWAGLIDFLHKGYTESHRHQLLIVSGFLAAFLFLSFRHYSANYFFYVLMSIGILYIAGLFRRLRI